MKKIVILDTHFKTKDEVFEKISALAEENGIVKKSKSFYKSLYKREKIGSTGMQHSIAIPHAIDKKILEASIIFIRNKFFIQDWKMLDETKPNIIVCLSMPKSEKTKHLDMLSSVAISLSDKANILKLSKAKKEEEIWKILKK